MPDVIRLKNKSFKNRKIGTDTIIVHESVIQKAVKEARLRAGRENMDSDYLFRFACIG